MKGGKIGELIKESEALQELIIILKNTIYCLHIYIKWKKFFYFLFSKTSDDIL